MATECVLPLPPVDLPNAGRIGYIDLETGADRRIQQVGAIVGTRYLHERPRGRPDRALARLDELCGDADWIVGHNVIGHDLVILREHRPGLGLLQRPVIDTLYLSTLVFVEHPYHSLVKDYKLVPSSRNSPVADAWYTARLLGDIVDKLRALQTSDPGFVGLMRYCFESSREAGLPPESRGMVKLLEQIGAPQLDLDGAARAFEACASHRTCSTALRQCLQAGLTEPQQRFALAYVGAWLRVAGKNSVLPRWIRTQLKEIRPWIDRLRDTDCGMPDCIYCREHFDAQGQLQRYFGFQFRDAPVHQDDRSLQEAVTTAGIRNQPHLALLPTGAGKSICYQLPALLRHLRRGQLTVVISPLQALMKDQVDGLARATGSNAAAALSGLLSPWERADVLDSIRMGDVGVLYVSPEQLRNRSVVDAIKSREVGAWVFDEAHCISKWGHDFRPDYLYVAKFIRRIAQEQQTQPPSIACFTATGQSQVVEDLATIFDRECGQALTVFEASPDRINLRFQVVRTTEAGKDAVLVDLIQDHLDLASDDGVCLVFASTRKRVQRIAEYVQAHDLSAAFFHAGLESEERRELIEQFLDGQYRVMVATNAFGMGIDKSDVRLVVHADIPGSLENYIQEAGRAGRDGDPATCVLLYDEKDIETQFQLALQSRLSWRDLSQTLAAIRKAARGKPGAELVLTTEEILGVTSDDPLDMAEDDHGAETKVKAALAWLERCEFLERRENRTRIFQARLVITDPGECDGVLDRGQVAEFAANAYRSVWREVGRLRPGELLSADQIMRLEPVRRYLEAEKSHRGRTSSQLVFRILTDMEDLGLIERTVLCSAEISDPRTKRARRLAAAKAVELALLDVMRERSADPDHDETLHLDLRRVREELLARLDLRPSMLELDWLRKLLVQLSKLRKGTRGRTPLFKVRHTGNHNYNVAVTRGWDELTRAVANRQDIALAVEQFLRREARQIVSAGSQWPAEISFELGALEALDPIKGLPVQGRASVVERVLLYLHGLESIVVRGGLAILRHAMTIRLSEDPRRRFTRSDYDLLGQHYDRRILQIHVMNEFAQIGANEIQSGLALAYEYFRLPEAEFVHKYFRGRKQELERALSREAYATIVDALANQAQQRIVMSPERQNQLILAGPGSGKTRTVVHRVAFLIGVHRVPPRNILVACFNRSAALQLRRRLRELIGARSHGVTVQTYHGVAMRLSGAAIRIEDAAGTNQGRVFDELIDQALEMLTAEDVTVAGSDGDPLRDRILRGYSHILVDEYQDIDEKQYALVRAIAGRWSPDNASAISILAVGDDDQTIYDWRGASTEYIRRFSRDFPDVREESLVENYRSSDNIIRAADQIISSNRDRMKTGVKLRRNRFRQHDPGGGRWEGLDPHVRGRVHVMQARDLTGGLTAIAAEIQRLKALAETSRWEDFAILCRTREGTARVRDVMDSEGVPCSWILPRDIAPPPFRIREMRAALAFLGGIRTEHWKAHDLVDSLRNVAELKSGSPWTRILERALEEWLAAEGDGLRRVGDLEDNLVFLLHEISRECRIGHGVHISTAHASKGLEFDHVFVVDDGWRASNRREDEEAQRRLLYVAMTRARENLAFLDSGSDLANLLEPLDGAHMLYSGPPSSRDAGPRSIVHTSHAIVGMKDINIGHAGRLPGSDPIHRHLARLGTGDPVQLRATPSGIEVCNESGATVARLSKAGSDAWRDRIGRVKRAHVLCLVERRRDDGDPEFRRYCQVESWEVPLIEVEVRE